jgi:hypothetical protein
MVPLVFWEVMGPTDPWGCKEVRVLMVKAETMAVLESKSMRASLFKT